MTPHDSTRCAVCAYEGGDHAYWCEAHLRPAPTEGVGAVDALERHCAALLDFESALREDGFTLFVDEVYVRRLREIREEGARLREQVATLTAIAKREKVAALNATEDAYRARATPAEGVEPCVDHNAPRPSCARCNAWLDAQQALYAAPVPSGVTEVMDAVTRYGETFREMGHGPTSDAALDSVYRALTAALRTGAR